MIVSRNAERSGSKGCPLIGAYVSSCAANSDWISSDFMYIGLAVDGFPPGPVPVGDGQILPYLIHTGESIGTQHGVGR